MFRGEGNFSKSFYWKPLLKEMQPTWEWLSVKCLSDHIEVSSNFKMQIHIMQLLHPHSIFSQDSPRTYAV